MRPLGKYQTRLLVVLGSPTRAMVVPDATAKSLVARGLLREREPDGMVCITPAGLRALADEMEAGRVDDALDAIRKDVDARLEREAVRALGGGE